MANILVLGGGFAGVVAAESLARRVGPEHRITLVSRHREFTFFPSLVRLAFGRLKLEDVFFDLAHAMRSQRVHKLWDDEGADLRKGRFWGWAKSAHTRYWTWLHALRPVCQVEE
jgi:NADH dehydrogenase FAD-containing subunit